MQKSVAKKIYTAVDDKCNAAFTFSNINVVLVNIEVRNGTIYQNYIDFSQN
jgi:hypothetical protein